jgi:hypothetical protein
MAAEDELKIEKPKTQEGLLASNMPTGEAPATKTTANNQSWESGDLKISDDGVYFTPKTATGTPRATSQAPGDTVASHLQGLLSSDSPYIKSARSSAQQQANQRGLLNSTMAATAGEKAAIESALPIATQDAGYFQQRGLNTQQGEIQKGLYETQGDISSRLSAQEHSQQKEMQAAEMEWNKIDLEARMQVEYDRMNQEAKLAFDERANAISQDNMKDFMELTVNPNFVNPLDRKWALDILAQNTKLRYEAAAAIAGMELDWGVPSEEIPYHVGWKKPGEHLPEGATPEQIAQADQTKPTNDPFAPFRT